MSTRIALFFSMACLMLINGCAFFITPDRITHKANNYDFTIVSEKDLDYTIIPIEIKNGLPLITVTLKGKKISLLLDSGGFAPIALNPEILQMLDIEYTGKSKTTYNIKGHRFKSKEFIVPELYLGDFKLLNVIGYESHHHKDYPPPLVIRNGSIGAGILRRFNLIVDYPDSKILLIKKGGVPPEDYQVSKWVRIPGGINTYEVELDNTKYKLKLGWDTGASFSVIKPRRKFLRKADDRGIVKFSNLRINNYDFGPVEFTFAGFNLPVDGCLGYSFFKLHKVYFDFKNDIVAIKKD